MDVLGLPLHPLVVHAAVVFVPLASLGALVVILLGRWRDRYGWLAVAFAVAAAGAAIAAVVTGQAFATSLHAESLVATHSAYGRLLLYPTIGLAVTLPAALLLRRRSPAGWRVAAGLTVVAAIAGLVLVVLTGHSGATAVWAGR